MKCWERFRLFAVIAGALFSSSIPACSTPKSIGGSQGGSTGTVFSGAGGSSAGTQATATTGQGGSAIIVLPDATIATPVDDRADAASAPASGDANCGSTQSKLEKKPADLLLLLDRSTSMTEAMDSSQSCAATSATCSQRWATIITSLNKVLTTSPGDLNWGLKFFSSPTTATGTGGRGGGGGGTSNCNVSAGVEVSVGPGNASKIATQISAAGNAGSTPTRAAVDAAVAYLKTVTDGNSKYILLATDGEPNCGQGSSSTTSDLTATVTAVKNAVAAGYKVFVIGVGPEAANLTSLAQAGGTDKFYSALTPDDLSSALTAVIGTVVASCSYDLTSAPVVPAAVGVFVDKALIPQSDSDGWSYAPGSDTTININGSYCDDLKNGRKTLVEIFLPCKATDPIPAVIP